VVAPIPDIVEDLEEPAQYGALAISKGRKQDKGKPIAWIELLSPSNKPGGQDDFYYADKRLDLIQGGVVFVEIDYLHETPPTFSKIFGYSANNGERVGIHPYRIIVIDPRPAFQKGQVYLYPFVVDVPIPIVNLPLSGKDILEFNFGEPYAQTIEGALFTLELVDYSQLPRNFERYSRDDQIRILARMLAVLKAARDGIDLETHAPLPVEAVGLDEGLTQLENFRGDT